MWPRVAAMAMMASSIFFYTLNEEWKKKFKNPKKNIKKSKNPKTAIKSCWRLFFYVWPMVVTMATMA